MVINGEAKAIATAFVKARKAMGGTVAKDGKGNYGKYATLAAIVEATTDVLAENGLAVVQEASTDDVGLVIETWLVHESGALMQFTPLTLPLTDRRPQAVGSAITYGRRYALAAICGLAPDDDDAQAAQDAASHADARRDAHKRPALGSKDNTQQTPQRAPVSPDNDVEFNRQAEPTEELPRLSEARHKMLHAVGRTLYGDEWDEQRPKLVQAVSKGAISSSNDLTPEEADKLIAGITKKINEVEGAKMKVAQAA